jgi:hypothetical protein
MLRYNDRRSLKRGYLAYFGVKFIYHSKKRQMFVKYTGTLIVDL